MKTKQLLKSIVPMLCILCFLLSGCGKSADNASNNQETSNKPNAFVGEWEITNIDLKTLGENADTSVTLHMRIITQLFPEAGKKVDFLDSKIGTAGQFISGATTGVYQILTDKIASINTVACNFELNGQTLTLDFEELATITLTKK